MSGTDVPSPDTLALTWERMIPEKMADDPASQQFLKLHVRCYEDAARCASGKSVLDIACGVGFGSQLLGRGGAQRVVGVDLSPDTIRYAQANYAAAGVEYVCADAEEFKWPERFDVVVSFATVEHLRDPARFLGRLRDLTVPGGVFMMSVPLGETRHFDRYHLHAFDAGQALALVTGAGFTVETSRVDDWFLGRRDVLRWFQLYPTARPTFRERFTVRGFRCMRDFVFRGGIAMPMLFVTARRGP